MTRQEDIKRVKRLLIYLGIEENKAEDIWEEFSHEGFEKPWMETSEEELEEVLEYIDKVQELRIEDVIRLQNIFIYFILWVYKVYRE